MASANVTMSATDSIIYLNVGGVRFVTSRSTLMWIPDSFFQSLLSGRIPSLKDEQGAIFIDRDPDLFKPILHYMRTQQVDLKSFPIATLRHEAQFYGLTPLVKRLHLCEGLNESVCGNVFFHNYISPPKIPITEHDNRNMKHGGRSHAVLHQPSASAQHSRNLSEPILPSEVQPFISRPLPSMDAKFQLSSVNAAGDSSSKSPAASAVNPAAPASSHHHQHNRTSSADLKSVFKATHSRMRNSSDMTKQIRLDLTCALKSQMNFQYQNPLRVIIIRGHHHWIAVAYPQFICCHRMHDSVGWQHCYTSPRFDHLVQHLALNAKFSQHERLLAVALSNQSIRLSCISDDGVENKIGIFGLSSWPIDALFFIGSQLVALSSKGRVGIWHSMTQNWQVQDVMPISSYDTATDSFLLLGSTNGCIYYIDMQKFPLRTKDNALLVTELYHDPTGDKITSISVYLTPKTTLCGNWIEIAYGTEGGAVRIIAQHPETVGQGPQLFQTSNVHQCPITRVGLSTQHLISVCTDYNHVRSWQVARFRGMINTQPGTTPLASFRLLTLDSADESQDSFCFNNASDVGPFGDQDSEQILVQKLVPETDTLYCRLASNGDRICMIKSVDKSNICSFFTHECESSIRIGSRPRRYLFTGHTNGCVQMWDLSTALEMYEKKPNDLKSEAGPDAEELLRLIDNCDIACSSLNGTPTSTPASSSLHLANRVSRQSSHE